MNEAQLLLQSHALLEKKKRQHTEELQKFLLIRESVIEVLGTRVPAPSVEFEFAGEKFSKSHVFPFVYLASPLLGADSLHKMFKSYADSIMSGEQDISETSSDEFDSLFQLISDGYETDEILEEMTGLDSKELLERKKKEFQDREVSQLSSSMEELDKMRKQIMEQDSPNTKQKKIDFNIKLGE